MADPQTVDDLRRALEASEKRNAALEKALEVCEQNFENAFERTGVGLAHTQLNGRLVRVNAHFCGLLGYSRDELLQTRFQDLADPRDAAEIVEIAKGLWAGEVVSSSLDKRYVRKDGSVFWANLHVSLVRGETPELTYFIAILKDVSALRRSENRFESSSSAPTIRCCFVRQTAS